MPPDVLARWSAASLQAKLAGYAAFLAAPVAILRAERLAVADLPAAERSALGEKWTRELGQQEFGRWPTVVRRLQPGQRWIETPDDKYLPAGLYEADQRRLYERFGLFLASWYWLGVRNRAYGVTRRHRYQWQEGDRFITTGEAHPGDSENPTRPGRWECAVFRHGECIAFETDEIRLNRWPAGTFRQTKRGWKLRAVLGRMALGLPPTEDGSAAGFLQPKSWRPFQKAVPA